MSFVLYINRQGVGSIDHAKLQLNKPLEITARYNGQDVTNQVTFEFSDGMYGSWRSYSNYVSIYSSGGKYYIVGNSVRYTDSIAIHALMYDNSSGLQRVSNDCTVLVRQQVSDLHISPTTLKVGEKKKLELKWKDGSQGADPYVTLDWFDGKKISYNQSAVIITHDYNERVSYIEGLSDGEVNLNFNFPDRSWDETIFESMGAEGTSFGTSITIEEPLRPVSLTVEPNEITMNYKGDKRQLSVDVVYNDGSSHEKTNSVTYSSSDPSIAMVSQSGVVSGNKGGSATITVSYTEDEIELSTTINVEVRNRILDKVRINPKSNPDSVEYYVEHSRYEDFSWPSPILQWGSLNGNIERIVNPADNSLYRIKARNSDHLETEWSDIIGRKFISIKLRGSEDEVKSQIHHYNSNGWIGTLRRISNKKTGGVAYDRSRTVNGIIRKSRGWISLEGSSVCYTGHTYSDCNPLPDSIQYTEYGEGGANRDPLGEYSDFLSPGYPCESIVGVTYTPVIEETMHGWTPNWPEEGMTYHTMYRDYEGPMYPSVDEYESEYEGWVYKNHRHIKDTQRTISAGFTYSIALKDDGSIEGWGNDSDSQLSDIPVGHDFIEVDARWSNVALHSDGSITAWGRGNGQLRDMPEGNDFVQVSSGTHSVLALKADGSILPWGSDDYNQISHAPEGNDFVQVSAGAYHHLALRADGTIEAWGTRDFDLVSHRPRSKDFAQISAGYGHNLALKTDGSIEAWAGAGYEQNLNVPEGNDFVQVSAGWGFSLALKADGSIVAWGAEGYGRILDTPSGNDFIQVSAGQDHALALKADGSIVSWGRDTDNQVSDTPNTSDFLTP